MFPNTPGQFTLDDMCLFDKSNISLSVQTEQTQLNPLPLTQEVKDELCQTHPQLVIIMLFRLCASFVSTLHCLTHKEQRKSYSEDQQGMLSEE